MRIPPFVPKLVIVGIVLLTLACTLISSATPSEVENQAAFTSAAQTVYVQLTLNAFSNAQFTSFPPEQAGTSVPPTETLFPTETMIPTDTPTLTPSVPQISANVDTNCRFAPNPIYDAVGYLLVGQTAEVIGKLSTQSWWLIRNPSRSGECWVWGTTTSVSGDVSSIAVIRLGFIAGWFYVDLNHNAKRDVGEPAVENQVVLYEGACPGIEERAILTVKLAEDGRYQFPDLPAGSYCVRYGVMAPLAPTEFTVNLTPGQKKDGINFYLTP